MSDNPILDRYLPRCEFDSYEDFMEHYEVRVPEHFNFGFDVVDGWAKLEPEKKALVWCDDNFEIKTFTFAQASELSNRAANAFRAAGVGRGDVVMLILKQRPEVWWCITALCKLGGGLHSRFLSAHPQGHRLPLQRRRRQNDRQRG